MKRYEYLEVVTLQPMSIEVLRLKGEMGWEMCGLTSYNNHGAQDFLYYFKKEIN